MLCVPQQLLRSNSGVFFKHIVVSDLSKKRDVEIPPGSLLSTAPLDVVHDPEVDVVIEVTRGTRGLGRKGVVRR